LNLTRDTIAITHNYVGEQNIKEVKTKKPQQQTFLIFPKVYRYLRDQKPTLFKKFEKAMSEKMSDKLKQLEANYDAQNKPWWDLI